MPLQKLVFRPGVNRENTSYANEGGYYASNKIRFRSGQPEKVGGWAADTGTTPSALKPTTGTLWGVCRGMWNWLNLSGYNLLALGTNLKYYIQNGTAQQASSNFNISGNVALTGNSTSGLGISIGGANVTTNGNVSLAGNSSSNNGQGGGPAGLSQRLHPAGISRISRPLGLCQRSSSSQTRAPRSCIGSGQLGASYRPGQPR